MRGIKMISKETSNYLGNTVPDRANEPNAADHTQFPSLEAPYAGWKVVEKDMVNYIDQQRRGLDFLFSVVRTASSQVIDSPMNKSVSVYQKPTTEDYVIVSKSGNNPNDIRIMEMTNEYYGEPDPDPMLLIQKTIEMADDSGMLRLREGYGNYMELADDSTLENFQKVTGASNMVDKPSASIITNYQSQNKKPIASKIFAAVKNLFIHATNKVFQTSAGARSKTVDAGLGQAVGGVVGAMKDKKSITPIQTMMAKHELKQQEFKDQFAAKSGFQEKMQNQKIQAAKEMGYAKLGAMPKDMKKQQIAGNLSTAASVSESDPNKIFGYTDKVFAAAKGQKVSFDKPAKQTTVVAAKKQPAPSTNLGPPAVSSKLKNPQTKAAAAPKSNTPVNYGPGTTPPSVISQMNNRFAPKKQKYQAGQSLESKHGLI